MRELKVSEIQDVSGGFDAAVSAGVTVGLMALAPASVLVMTTGLVALAFYATMSFMRAPIIK